jgi:hypothetical protein
MIILAIGFFEMICAKGGETSTYIWLGRTGLFGFKRHKLNFVGNTGRKPGKGIAGQANFKSCHCNRLPNHPLQLRSNGGARQAETC